VTLITLIALSEALPEALPVRLMISEGITPFLYSTASYSEPKESWWEDW